MTDLSNQNQNLSTRNLDVKFLVHIACEIVVIGGITVFFYKKISNLQKEIDELKNTINEYKKSECKCLHSDTNTERYVKKDELEKFGQHTQSHINRLYQLFQQVIPRIQVLENEEKEQKLVKNTEENLDKELSNELKELEKTEETKEESEKLEKLEKDILDNNNETNVNCNTNNNDKIIKGKLNDNFIDNNMTGKQEEKQETVEETITEEMIEETMIEEKTIEEIANKDKEQNTDIKEKQVEQESNQLEFISPKPQRKRGKKSKNV